MARPGDSREKQFRSYAEELIRLHLKVEHVRVKTWRPGQKLPENIIDTHRLIWLQRGGLDYRVEKASHRFQAPGLLYVPGWVRRSWRSLGAGPARMLWVEFSSDLIDHGLNSPFFLKGKIKALEGKLFEELRQGWGDAAGRVENRLLWEQEAKTLLALFFERLAREGGLGEKDEKKESKPDHEVVRLLDDLRKNFHEEGALQKAVGRAGVSPDYLRRLFVQRTGQSLQAYVKQLRMRKARQLLHGGELRVKEVAARTGYPDALRFSKIYREFWGHPPSAEKQG